MIENFSSKELETIKHLRNHLVHEGRMPSIRKLMRVLGYKSPRSVSIIIDDLVAKGVLRKKEDGSLMFFEAPKSSSARAQTIDVPILGAVACGSPVFAEENIEGVIKVSTNLAPIAYKHFILRAKGDSMDKKGIDDGDFVLIRQQSTASNGEDVLALIDDEATIKEYHRKQNTVLLNPCSTNPDHHPIVLTDDFQIQGVVVTTIPKL